MAFEHMQCVVLRCDACGHDGDDGDDYGVPHWQSEDDALKQAEPMCARGFEDDDCDAPRFHTMPDGRVLCRSCAHKTLCTAGHQWSERTPWTDLPAGSFRTRYCERCDASEYDRRVGDR